MDKNYMQKKIQTKALHRSLNDRGLKIFLIVFVIGYIFFFSSNYFFPKIYKYKNVACASSTYSSDNFEVMVGSIDYSKSDHEMEIILEYRDLLVEDGIKYTVACKHDTDIYKARIYKTFKNYMIIRIEDLPRRFTECSIFLSNGFEDINFSINDKNVTNVDRIYDKSNNEYISREKYQVIQGYKEQIKEKQKLIKNTNSKIKLANKKIKQLQFDQKQTTETQASQIESKILDLNQRKEALKTEKDGYNEEIAELQANIKLKESE